MTAGYDIPVWNIDRTAYDSIMGFIFSREKVSVSLLLLSQKEGEYVQSFMNLFERNYLSGRSVSEVLSNLDTLHRYSNNYIVFSPVRDLVIPESLMTPERLFGEVVGRA